VFINSSHNCVSVIYGFIQTTSLIKLIQEEFNLLIDYTFITVLKS